MLNKTTSYGTPFDFIAVYWVFSYIIDDHSPNFHILFFLLLYIFWYVNMPNVSVGYGSFSDLIVFFLGIFIYCYIFESLEIHQTFKKCVLVKTEM